MRLFITIPFTEEFRGELISVQNEMRVERVCLMNSERINGKLTYNVLGEVHP